jgi:hypothetical protein
LGPKSGSNLTFNSSSGILTAGGFVGTLTGNADTATTASIATTVTITDNESTNEDNAIVFTAGGDVDGGNIGLESDGTLIYNPSTGKITATGFIGALTGNVTGNCTGTAATVTTAAQSAITSLGTLTALTVDGTIAVGGSAKELRFHSGANYVGFKAPSLSGDKIWVLPAADGTASQVLKTDGSGVLSWTDVVAATATLATNVTATANNTANETVYLTFVDGVSGPQGIETDAGLTYNPFSGILSTASLNTTGDIEVDGNISLSGSNKELRFYEGINYVGFEAPALTGDKIWVLPSADGSANQVLKTDGSANLGWADGGGSSIYNVIKDSVSASSNRITSSGLSIPSNSAITKIRVIITTSLVFNDDSTRIAFNLGTSDGGTDLYDNTSTPPGGGVEAYLITGPGGVTASGADQVAAGTHYCIDIESSTSTEPNTYFSGGDTVHLELKVDGFGMGTRNITAGAVTFIVEYFTI